MLAYTAFFAVLFAGLLLWLDYKEQKNVEKQQFEQRKKELEDLAKEEQSQERLQLQQDREQEEKVLENRKKRMEYVSRRSSSRSLPPAPTPTIAPPTSPHRSTVESACRSARCTLVQYQEQGGSSYILVEGPDHNSVSDVLVELRRSGMKDFTEHKDKYNVRYQNGQPIYTAAYTIKW